VQIESPRPSDTVSQRDPPNRGAGRARIFNDGMHQIASDLEMFKVVSLRGLRAPVLQMATSLYYSWTSNFLYDEVRFNAHKVLHHKMALDSTSKYLQLVREAYGHASLLSWVCQASSTTSARDASVGTIASTALEGAII
jgi:hypothetical protein